MKTAVTKHARLTWVDVAKGMAIILMVVGHEVTSRHLHAVIFSFHMPLFFILSGYTSRPVATWARWWQKVKKSLVQVWLLATLMICLLGLETLVLKKNLGILEIWHAVLGGIFWGSNNYVRGQYGAGVMWFLFVFFWAKLLFDAVQIILPSWVRGIVLTLLSVGSFALAPNPMHWLPQAFDLVPVAALFMWLGELWKGMDNHVNYHRPLTWLGLGIIGTFWLVCVARAVHIELAIRMYPDYFGSVIEALAGTIIFCLFAQWVERSPYLMRVLSTVGRHTLAVLCIHHLDLYWVNWGAMIHSWPLAAGVRLALDMVLLILWVYAQPQLKKIDRFNSQKITNQSS